MLKYARIVDLKFVTYVIVEIRWTISCVSHDSQNLFIDRFIEEYKNTNTNTDTKLIGYEPFVWAVLFHLVWIDHVRAMSHRYDPCWSHSHNVQPSLHTDRLLAKLHNRNDLNTWAMPSMDIDLLRFPDHQRYASVCLQCRNLCQSKNVKQTQFRNAQAHWRKIIGKTAVATTKHTQSMTKRANGIKSACARMHLK